MSPDSLITVFSLLIAVFALLPQERRLDFKARISWYDWLIAVLAVGLVHYILYFPVLNQLGWGLPLGPWRWGFTPELATYSIFAITICWGIVRLRYGQLSRRQVPAFGRLATRLLHQQPHGDLAELLDRNLSHLMRAYNNNYRIIRLRNWLSPPSWHALVRTRSENGKRSKAWAFIASKLALCLPTYATTRDSAKETVRRVLLSEPFVGEAARTYPYLGLDILNYEFSERDAFQRMWLGQLLDDSNSVFFDEIEHNQNSRGAAQHRFEYDARKRYLWFYFNEIRIAEKRNLYKTLGDYYCEELDRRLRDTGVDRFNAPLDRYADLEESSSPDAAVLRLFDYMITESFYQGIRWHMWLHYLPIFVDKIIRNLAPEDTVDLTAEFPTPYHYHLYDIVALLCEWIAIARDASETQPPQKDEDIPMQSVLALGRVLNSILTTPKLEDAFKAYMLEVVVGRVHDWRSDSKLESLADALIERIAAGGRDHGVAQSWLSMVRGLLTQADFIRFHATIDKLTERLHSHWPDST